ncbi:MAG: class beta-lactamase-related serine hydrolase, partial [Alphaproteobacteria bacterium]|nr:class beta-lactamase-related serine hydrolase [Alphaproteobacteria bacterium]
MPGRASLKARIASASIAALVLGLFIIGASGGSISGGGSSPGAAAAPGPSNGIQISEAQRRATAIDYGLLDSRLQQLAQKDPVVGLAVGVVEDGEIRFLKGYGETVA